MKRLLVVIALISIVGSSTLAWGQLPHFNPGDVLHAVDLNDIVDQIKVNGIAQTIQVDCATGTISQGLQQAAPGDTVQITGTCRENVVITKSSLTLDGQGTTTIDGGGQTVISISGHRGITIRNLTVHNGVHGIQALRTATLNLQGVTTQDNTTDGINLNESAGARITDCTIQHNGRHGLGVFGGSIAALAGTIISSNNGAVATPPGDGIHVTTHSSLADTATASITTNNNANDGIFVGQHSFFVAAQSGTTLTAQANPLWGLQFTNTSSFFLGTGTALTASGNGRTGVFSGGLQVSTNSSFTVQSGNGATLAVQNNLDRGIVVSDSGVLVISGGPSTIQGNTIGLDVFRGAQVVFQGATLTADISQNTGNGVQLGEHAIGRLNAQTAGAITVHDNGGMGITVNEKSDLNLTNVILDNNRGTGGALNLFNGASANLNTVTIRNHANLPTTTAALNINLGSSIFVDTTTITGNAGGGISLFNGSTISLSNSTVSNNQGTASGLGLFDHCSANLSNVQISGHPNARFALQVGLNSSAFMNTTGVVVTSNGHIGVLVSEVSSLVSDGALHVTGNTDNGVQVDDSSLRLQNATLTGNGGADLAAFFGSHLNLNAGNVIGICSHDPAPSVLIRGNTSRLCP